MGPYVVLNMHIYLYSGKKYQTIFVFTYMYKIEDDVLLHRKQCDPEQSQNHELHWADFTQNRAVGDQAAGHTEVCIDQAENGPVKSYALDNKDKMTR